jgi:hypothetical protein
LAGLPHLLIGLVGALPSLAAAAGIQLLSEGVMLNVLPLVLIVPALLGGVIYGWRRGWGRWSASWSVFLTILPVLLLTLFLPGPQAGRRS